MPDPFHPVPTVPPAWQPATPPPEPPQPPESGQFPRWPAWYGPVGLVVALILTLFIGGLAGIVAAIATQGEIDELGPAANFAATAVQDVIFLATAFGFAWLTTRPRLWHFGLRRARFWPALGWSVLGVVAFYVLAALYVALIGMSEPQTTLDDLGADESELGLVAAAVLVVVFAPVVEEIFFRGFFYRSLRGRLPPLAAAAIVGVVFGAIHLPTGPAAVPILIALGIILCLVYERTGTLYSVIGMHAFNNAVAFGLLTERPRLALGLGGAMIALCVAAPLLSSRRVPAVA